MTTHSLPIRVYYEDTDAGGVVYHASYLRFAERARTEALRAAGAAHAELQTIHGLIFVVRRLEMDYLRPARLDQLLLVETTPLALGGASVTLRQRFFEAGEALATLTIRMVCIEQATLRPARIPDRWRAVLLPDEPGAEPPGGTITAGGVALPKRG